MGCFPCSQTRRLPASQLLSKPGSAANCPTCSNKRFFSKSYRDRFPLLAAGNGNSFPPPFHLCSPGRARREPASPPPEPASRTEGESSHPVPPGSHRLPWAAGSPPPRVHSTGAARWTSSRWGPSLPTKSI